MIAIGLLVIAAASASLPNPVEDRALRRMVEASHQVCTDPPIFGYSASGTAGAVAQGGAGKVVGLLAGLRLSAELRVRGEVHRGPSQKDVGSMEVARLECAGNVFADMLARFAITDRDSGRRVAPSPHPRATFERLSRPQAIGPLTTIQNTGGGEQAVSSNQTGGITANHIDTIVLDKDRSIYLAMLQSIYSEGQTILAEIGRHPPSDEITPRELKRANDWIESSTSRIAASMTPAAAQSFQVVRRSPMSMVFNPPLAPAPSADTMNAYNNLLDLIPQYLRNVQYLMEHDTMDPQNKASQR